MNPIDSAQPRRPWAAALMSMLLPGLGQLYNGQAQRAIWCFLVFALLVVPAVAMIALWLPAPMMMPVLLIGLAATLGTWLWSIADAWREASRQPNPPLQAWQRSGTYALVFVVCNLVALPMLVGQVREHRVESFRIPSQSMEPSVMQGDFLFADKRYNCPGCPQSVARGDIAIFVYPNDRSRRYIKRIIGLPGDRITIRDKVVSVNGTPLSGPGPAGVQGSGTTGAPANAANTTGSSVVERLGDRVWTVTWTGPAAGEASMALDLEVPAGMVFVLGDRRETSADSRSFGPVPLRDVVGRARQVWYSQGPQGVRWDRLGAQLR